jgi:glycosyltransferase involved in cell wall biosynthesis
VDGPIPPQLEQIVDIYDRLYSEITVKKLPKNLGAGPARNVGIKLAKNPLVAIQDADDISTPERFALELAEFNKDSKLTLVGGQLAEFENNNPKHITSYRHVPLTYPEICHFARRRMPVNNPTIMFKKNIIRKINYYGDSNRSEDYLLVIKLIKNNYLIANIPEVVALYRTNTDCYSRRKNWGNLIDFIVTRQKIHALGMATTADFLIPCVAQLIITVSPKSMIRTIYRRALRK